MSEKTLVVVVPVYNVERYVSMCIDSLLDQSYTPMKIVLVNDCSTDNSLSILKDYEKRFPDNIIVIDSKENMGIGGARNLGMRFSESDYIGFVDSDDFVHPQMYEALMREVVSGNEDAVYCEYTDVPKGATPSDVSDIVNGITWGKEEIERLSFSGENRERVMGTHKYGTTWTGVYRRGLIEETGLMFPEHLAYEDNFWVYALQLHMKDVAIVHRPLYYYRRQDDSTSHKKNAKHHYDRLTIEKMLYDYVVEKGLLKDNYNIIEYIYISVQTYNTLSLFFRYVRNPDYGELRNTRSFLKNHFPHWSNNPLFQDRFSRKQKLKMYVFMYLPLRLCRVLFPFRK